MVEYDSKIFKISSKPVANPHPPYQTESQMFRFCDRKLSQLDLWVFPQTTLNSRSQFTRNHSETALKQMKIVSSEASSTNLRLEPEVQNNDRNDRPGILARLETLMAAKNLPELLHENKRMFKFKSIVKLAKTNLNSIKQKISEGNSVLENFRDGSIWFVAAIHSVPADKHAECLQLISHFFTNGHVFRPKQNDEVVERLLGICGYINFLEANTDEDAFKFLLSLKAIRDAKTTSVSMAQSKPTLLTKRPTPHPDFYKDDEETDQDL